MPAADRGRVGANVRREARRRRNLEQEVFRKAWRILTITDCLRQRLIGEYGVPPDRVFTVPDGSRASIDTPQRTAEQSKSCQRANGSDSSSRPRFRLIYVGQLYPWKGVDLAIRAMSEVPGAELTIVGGLPHDPQLGRLKRLVGKLGHCLRELSYAGRRR